MKKDSFMSTVWGYKDIITVCGSDLKEDMQELNNLRAEVKERDELIKAQTTQIVYLNNKINVLNIQSGVYVDLRS